MCYFDKGVFHQCMEEQTVYAEKTDLDESSHKTVAWHAVSEDIVSRRVQATIKGLTTKDVEERQREFGKNVLPAKEPPTPVQVFLH